VPHPWLSSVQVNRCWPSPAHSSFREPWSNFCSFQHLLAFFCIIVGWAFVVMRIRGTWFRFSDVMPQKLQPFRHWTHITVSATVPGIICFFPPPWCSVASQEINTVVSHSLFFGCGLQPDPSRLCFPLSTCDWLPCQQGLSSVSGENHGNILILASHFSHRNDKLNFFSAEPPF
jgi:hypothetical protein